VRILGTLHARGARASASGERRRRKKEEGMLNFFGGRRGSRLRLGADFGYPPRPEEPARAPAERGGRGGRRRRKEFEFFWGKKRQAGFA
jgi:hypothetical protein